MVAYTALVIERKCSLPDWETVAYPKNDMGEALRVLEAMRKEEQTKRYKKPLRLVRITREHIDA